jgi:lambda family phage portal protein
MNLASTFSDIFPGWAAKRQVARAKLAAANRLYEAVQASNYRPRRGSSASADVVMDAAKSRPREYGRWLDENHDLAIGVLDDLVSNIVGAGVGVEPMCRWATGDKAPIVALNDDLLGLWSDFWRAPEITGEIPGPELERLVCRSWLRDGEVFAQHVTAPIGIYPGPIQYAIQAFESDWVPFELIETRDGVIHGVQKDRFGRPRVYFLYAHHPGDRLGFSVPTDLIPVSADNMMHIKFTRRLHQTRGVSILHGVFTRLDDVKDYEESERVAARVQAAISLFIKDTLGSEIATAPVTNDRMMQMAPGMVFRGLPGEEPVLLDPNRPNNNVGNFIAIQERRIAAGTGTRRSAIGRDYNGTYSAQRQELVEGAVHYRKLFSYLVAKFYLPVWRRFIDQSRVSGLLRVPSGIDMRSLYLPELRQQPLPWIDPLKEVNAHAMAVERGFRSRQQVIRDLGGDPRKVDAQLEADPYDVRPPETGAKPNNPASTEDDRPMEDAA